MSFFVRRMMMAVDDKKYTFGGVEISPGPVYYDGSTFKLADNWYEKEYSSGVKGLVANSLYFTLHDIATYFDSAGDSFPNNRDIDNSNTIDGWRIPTLTEIQSWYGGVSRTTASVSGSSGRYYSKVCISDKSYNGASTPMGTVFYPDASSQPTVDASFISYFNTSTYTTITEAQLNSLLSQGCVFFPPTGYLSGNTLNSYSDMARYWSGTWNNSNSFWALNAPSSSQVNAYVIGYNAYYPCRLVKSI